MDYEQVARELIRALRGKRSQRALSRRLGYRTNVVYTWESGRRWPTACETLRVASLTRVDVTQAIHVFYQAQPSWMHMHPLSSPEFVAAFLRDLRGQVSILTLAERTGYSRYAISRWLSGRAEPRLPQFLALVEAASLRLLDLLAAFVDPAQLDSVRAQWAELLERRRTAWKVPWSHAVLRVLEVDDYRAQPTHRPGWVAQRIGISHEEEARCIEALETAGLIAWDGTRYRVEEVTVDTRANPDHARRALKAHWIRVACDRLEQGALGLFSFNVFSISGADLDKLKEMHVRYFTALRSVVASSRPPERVAVVSLQLYELSSEPKGAA